MASRWRIRFGSHEEGLRTNIMALVHVPLGSESMDRCNLNLRNIVFLGIALASSQPLLAQCGDDCKVNTNLAAVITVPVSQTARVASIGWGTVAGVGYSLNKQNALIGEFMWNRVSNSSGSLQPLQAAEPSVHLTGNSDIFTLTGNYRFELRGRLLGTYLIGGGGWYLRNTSLSAKVTAGAATPCAPVWLWWGFTCSSGMVNPNQSLESSHSNALGANLGIGFTVRVVQSPYRLYSEARYHYIPQKNINAQFVAATI